MTKFPQLEKDPSIADLLTKITKLERLVDSLESENDKLKESIVKMIDAVVTLELESI